MLKPTYQFPQLAPSKQFNKTYTNKKPGQGLRLTGVDCEIVSR